MEEQAKPKKSFVDDVLKRFTTPAWAKVLVINNIEEFTDNELSTIKLFVLDEIEKRAKKAGAQ